MRNYKRRKRLAKNLVNLTSTPICVYEEATGEIVTFLPQEGKVLPETPFIEDRKRCPKVYYMVGKDHYNQIVESGRGLEDIAVIMRTDIGRNAKKISFLFWGADLDVEIRFYNGSYIEMIE